MNAGLSNLATLKAWLLPASLLTSTDYDEQIKAIGLGVAAQIEKHCNRQFQRTDDDTFEFSADVEHVILPRYPIEEISKIEIRETLVDGWVEQTIADAIQQISEKSGLVSFGTILGGCLDRARITYTGGYFFETLEPEDEEFPTDIPEDSFALPADLLLAWKIQCAHVWAQSDKLGLAIGEKPTASPPLAQIELLKPVQAALQPFVRYTLT